MYEGLKIALKEWKYYVNLKEEALEEGNEIIELCEKHIRYIAKFIRLLVSEIRSNNKEFEKLTDEDELVGVRIDI